ncbi:uncharacterized protein LOC141618867 [Silene latifolia]|uniref:uncharacterized protein LOC141618867 n=1 Tax=Silene latifolia TaxID=37657 RepID=UPI003D7835B1
MAELEPKAIEVKEGEEVDIETLSKELEAHNNRNSDRIFVRTNIGNRTKKPLFPVESHFWHGSTYAKLITLSAPGGYDYPQFGTPPEGLKYGILYADGDDSLSRQFLAAVHVPLPVNVDANNFKVYVEAGPIGPIDWNVVEVKLNMATSNKAVYDDPIFGGQVHAEVSKERNGYTFISFRN